MNYEQLAKTLETIHGQDGGLTWNFHRGNARDIIELKHFRFVAVVSVFPERSRILLHPPTANDFLQFIAENEADLTVPATWLCVGSWYDDRPYRRHYLDLSEICLNRRRAHRLGLQHKQDSVYLLHKGRSERLNSPYMQARRDRTWVSAYFR